MSAKRQATSDLNHENWDREEEPEDRGEFRTASAEELKTRVIKKARRKVEGPCGDAPKSVFSGFGGFGTSASKTASSSPFSFLAKLPAAKDETPKQTINFQLNNKDSEKPTTSNAAFSFLSNISSSTTSATVPTATATSSFSFGVPRSFASKDFEIGKSVESSKPKEKSLNYSDEYCTKLKQLNEQFYDWVGIHITEHPVCWLTPVFKDYEKFLKELDDEENNKNKLEFQSNLINKDANENIKTITPKTEILPSGTLTSENIPALNTKGIFSFGKNPSDTKQLTNAEIGSPESSGTKIGEFKSPSSTVSSPLVKPTFNFGNKSESTNPSTTPLKSNGFSFGTKINENLNTATSTGLNFGTNSSSGFSFKPNSTPFSFGNIQPPPPATETSISENGNEDNDEDAPPKVEFKQVVENDSVYSKKCKVFVKKDGDFADLGVGTLHLKPVKDSEKTQLIVRADTNLGNILVNLLLSEAIPSQRMGKNNVMMVCIPNSNVEKPTPTLFRVKTAEDADELLEMIKTHTK